MRARQLWTPVTRGQRRGTIARQSQGKLFQVLVPLQETGELQVTEAGGETDLNMEGGWGKGVNGITLPDLDRLPALARTDAYVINTAGSRCPESTLGPHEVRNASRSPGSFSDAYHHQSRPSAMAVEEWLDCDMDSNQYSGIDLSISGLCHALKTKLAQTRDSRYAYNATRPSSFQQLIRSPIQKFLPPPAGSYPTADGVGYLTISPGQVHRKRHKHHRRAAMSNDQPPRFTDSPPPTRSAGRSGFPP